MPTKIIHQMPFSMRRTHIWDKRALICDEICCQAFSFLSVILFNFAEVFFVIGELWPTVNRQKFRDNYG